MNKVEPTRDLVFKRIFGKVGNEEILKEFLEAIYEEIRFLVVVFGLYQWGDGKDGNRKRISNTKSSRRIG